MGHVTHSQIASPEQAPPSSSSSPVPIDKCNEPATHAATQVVMTIRVAVVDFCECSSFRHMKTRRHSASHKKKMESYALVARLLLLCSRSRPTQAKSAMKGLLQPTPAHYASAKTWPSWWALIYFYMAAPKWQLQRKQAENCCPAWLCSPSLLKPEPSSRDDVDPSNGKNLKSLKAMVQGFCCRLLGSQASWDNGIRPLRPSSARTTREPSKRRCQRRKLIQTGFSTPRGEPCIVMP